MLLVGLSFTRLTHHISNMMTDTPQRSLRHWLIILLDYSEVPSHSLMFYGTSFYIIYQNTYKYVPLCIYSRPFRSLSNKTSSTLTTTVEFFAVALNPPAYLVSISTRLATRCPRCAHCKPLSFIGYEHSLSIGYEPWLRQVIIVTTYTRCLHKSRVQRRLLPSRISFFCLVISLVTILTYPLSVIGEQLVNEQVLCIPPFRLITSTYCRRPRT